MMLVSAFLAAALAQEVPTSEFLETRQLVEEPPAKTTASLATSPNGSHLLEGKKVDCLIEAVKEKKAFTIVDFDRTLTRQTNADGSKGKSSHNVIKLPKELQKQKDEDFDYYHKIEIDANKSQKDKLPDMITWYNRTHTLLEKSGITQKQMEQDVRDEKQIGLRDGVEEFFAMCKKLGIPVVVMSAGLGTVAKLTLQRDLKGKYNYAVASNNFIWSKATPTSPSKIIGVAPPLVHMFNKSWAGVSEDIRQKYKLYEKKFALVIGDSDGDASMVNGSDFGSLKIGFLNKMVDPETGKRPRTAEYNCLFDRVLLGGGAEGESFKPIVEMLGRVEGATTTPELLKEPVCQAPKANPVWDNDKKECTSNAGSLGTLLLLSLSVFFLL